MWPFRHKHTISFRRPKRDGFRLDTADITEHPSFWKHLLGGRRKREEFARYIAAGGTRESRGQEGPDSGIVHERSWRRFSFVITLLAVLWLLGMFL